MPNGGPVDRLGVEWRDHRPQQIMALSPGTRLGHYDVTSLLGEGGMGQVWQATDTQLNRQVALKILPDAFASDPDRPLTRPTGFQELWGRQVPCTH